MPSILDLYNQFNIARIDDAQIEMERNGFMLDANYCHAGYELACIDERRVLDTLAGLLAQRLGRQPVNPDAVWSSHPKLTACLEKVFKLPPSPYRTKGKVNLDAGERSTDKRALDWILTRVGDDKEARCLIEGIVELRRIRSSAKYLEKLPRFIGPDGFIHPTCGPAGDEDDRVGAITGRFGMKLPEGQQIPKDPKKDKYFIRRAFIAPPGMKLIIADYSALEVVILANICEFLFGDTLLLDLTGPGTDIHAYNAYNIFGRLLDWRTDSGRRIKDFSDPKLYKEDKELEWYRDTVKAVWYKLQYGGTVYGFATSLKGRDGNLLGEARAQEILDALYEACPPIRKWHDWVAEQLRERPVMCGLDGREVNYADLISRGKWGFAAACRGADNTPMQVTGAAIIGAAMVSVIDCPDVRRNGGLLQLQIHDELQLRGPMDNAGRLGEILVEHMESAWPMKNLRATVGVGDNWAEAKAPAKKAT